MTADSEVVEAKLVHEIGKCLNWNNKKSVTTLSYSNDH